jgi:hypothetical protein
MDPNGCNRIGVKRNGCNGLVWIGMGLIDSGVKRNGCNRLWFET